MQHLISPSLSGENYPKTSKNARKQVILCDVFRKLKLTRSVTDHFTAIGFGIIAFLFPEKRHDTKLPSFGRVLNFQGSCPPNRPPKERGRLSSFSIIFNVPFDKHEIFDLLDFKTNIQHLWIKSDPKSGQVLRIVSRRSLLKET